VLTHTTMSLFYATDFSTSSSTKSSPLCGAGLIVLADRTSTHSWARDLVRGADRSCAQRLQPGSRPRRVFYSASRRPVVDRNAEKQHARLLGSGRTSAVA